MQQVVEGFVVRQTALARDVHAVRRQVGFPKAVRDVEGVPEVFSERQFRTIHSPAQRSMFEVGARSFSRGRDAGVVRGRAHQAKVVGIFDECEYGFEFLGDGVDGENLVEPGSQQGEFDDGGGVLTQGDGSHVNHDWHEVQVEFVQGFSEADQAMVCVLTPQLSHQGPSEDSTMPAELWHWPRK